MTVQDPRAGQPDVDRHPGREQRYAALVENSPYCIHEVDEDGRLASMNPAGLRMMGADDECAIIGVDYLDAVAEKDQPRIRELLDKALDGEFSEFEFTAVNGRVFRSNFVPLPSADGEQPRLMGITQDVTERRELERKFHRSRQLDAVGRLAGGVAHDFNNLLTVILGSAELLEARYSADEPEIRAILDAADRAAELTSQLLTFARRQITRPRVVDLVERVRGLESLLRRILAENILLECVLTEDRLLVNIDPSQLDQVILNLATNARDAMPTGGTLRLSADVVSLVAGASGELAAGDYARFRVVDDGSGIADELLENIFDPFFTTKDATGGIGLGLATCHGIVVQAGGELRVRSSGTSGTAFDVLLPIATAPETVATTVVDREVSDPLTVLLVEDNDSVRSFAQQALTVMGHTVYVATSGEEAVDVVRGVPGSIDLLFTDVVLPGMNGRALADQLAEQRPDMAVLFTSGYMDDDVLTAGVKERRFELLPKPYTPDSLSRAVCRAVVSSRAK